MLVVDVLLRNHITPNLKGFDYLVNAVVFTIEYKKTNKVYPQVTKEVYSAVAKMFNVSATKVERAIRHIVSKIQTKELKETDKTNGSIITYFALKELSEKEMLLCPKN